MAQLHLSILATVLLVLGVACIAVDAGIKAKGGVPLRHSADYMYTSKYKNHVYLATYSSDYNNVQVVDLDTMTQLTSIQVPAPQDTHNAQGWLTPGATHLYISTSGSGVNAYSLKDGSLSWSFPIQDAYGPAYSQTYDEVYVVDGGCLYALDAGTGASKWNNTAHYYQGQPFVLDPEVVMRTKSGGLVFVDISFPTVALLRPGVNPLWGGSALQAFGTKFGSLYIQTGANDGTYGVSKINLNTPWLDWSTTGMTAPSNYGSWQNNLQMTEGPYNLWAYNGSNIVTLDELSGVATNVIPMHSNSVNGLVNLNGDYILSIPAGVDIPYFSTSFDTYSKKFTVPNATVIKAALPTKGATKVVLLTDVPSVIVLESTP